MAKLVYLNPTERPSESPYRTWSRDRTQWILWAGHAYSSNPTYFVYYGCLDSALDEVIDWLADPKNEHTGVLCNDAVEEAYKAYLAEHNQENIPIDDLDESLLEEARNVAEEDTISGGNCGDYIMSDSWGIQFENPTRQQVKDLIADLKAKAYDNSSVVVIC